MFNISKLVSDGFYGGYTPEELEAAEQARRLKEFQTMRRSLECKCGAFACMGYCDWARNRKNK